MMMGVTGFFRRKGTVLRRSFLGGFFFSNAFVGISYELYTPCVLFFYLVGFCGWDTAFFCFSVHMRLSTLLFLEALEELVKRKG